MKVINPFIMDVVLTESCFGAYKQTILIAMCYLTVLPKTLCVLNDLQLHAIQKQKQML